VVDGNKIHNGEIEIYPHAHPVILLAGTVELRWDSIEAALHRKGNLDIVQQNVQQPSPGQPISPQYKPEVIVHHAVKKGDDASAGFGRAFGETTGKAVGCLVVVAAIIGVLVLIANLL
jgi:hypothetical protein